MTDNEISGIYFLVGEVAPSRYGFVWRVWSGGTSFYIKPRWENLAGFKVSLHGPDPRPGLKPVYKLDRDHDAPPAHYEIDSPGFLPATFPGRQVGHGMTHVVRIAVPADTFNHPAARFGPPAGNVRRRMRAGYIDIPEAGSYASLDLYISEGKLPTWPGRERVEAQNAIAGELSNAAGQRLIGVTSHRGLDRSPLPDSLRTHDAAPDDLEVTRGVAAAIDEHGFVWLCERLMSEASLRAAAADG